MESLARHCFVAVPLLSASIRACIEGLEMPWELLPAEDHKLCLAGGRQPLGAPALALHGSVGGLHQDHCFAMVGVPALHPVRGGPAGLLRVGDPGEVQRVSAGGERRQAEGVGALLPGVLVGFDVNHDAVQWDEWGPDRLSGEL